MLLAFVIATGVNFPSAFFSLLVQPWPLSCVYKPQRPPYRECTSAHGVLVINSTFQEASPRAVMTVLAQSLKGEGTESEDGVYVYIKTSQVSLRSSLAGPGTVQSKSDLLLKFLEIEHIFFHGRRKISII